MPILEIHSPWMRLCSQLLSALWFPNKSVRLDKHIQQIRLVLLIQGEERLSAAAVAAVVSCRVVSCRVVLCRVPYVPAWACVNSARTYMYVLIPDT